MTDVHLSQLVHRVSGVAEVPESPNHGTQPRVASVVDPKFQSVDPSASDQEHQRSNICAGMDLRALTAPRSPSSTYNIMMRMIWTLSYTETGCLMMGMRAWRMCEPVAMVDILWATLENIITTIITITTTQIISTMVINRDIWSLV